MGVQVMGQKTATFRKIMTEGGDKTIVNGKELSQSKFTLIKRFKDGKIPVDEFIDLHDSGNMRTALKRLAEFVHECLYHDLRCLLVICGKGKHSPDGKAVLRDAVKVWLKEQADIIDYRAAKREDGGDGAFYVLLKHR